MDLESIEEDIVAAAVDDPRARTVLLVSDVESREVEYAIIKPLQDSLQTGSTAILQGQFQTWVLVKRFCKGAVPGPGNVIVDRFERWSITNVTRAYGGLVFQCSCVLQQ